MLHTLLALGFGGFHPLGPLHCPQPGPSGDRVQDGQQDGHKAEACQNQAPGARLEGQQERGAGCVGLVLLLHQPVGKTLWGVTARYLGR